MTERERLAKALRWSFWQHNKHEAVPCSWNAAAPDIRRDYLARADAFLAQEERPSEGECDAHGPHPEAECPFCGLSTTEGEREPADCHDCGEPYWYDFVVPEEVWKQISPREYSPGGGGILCAQCTDKRCAKLGIKALGRWYFTGDAVRSEFYEDEPGHVAAWEEIREILDADSHPEVTWLPDLLRALLAQPQEQARQEEG